MDDDNARIDNTEEREYMQIAAPEQTERSRQKLRVDHATASLIRRLDTLAPGVRVVVIVDVDAHGRRAWSLAHVTEVTP